MGETSFYNVVVHSPVHFVCTFSPKSGANNVHQLCTCAHLCMCSHVCPSTPTMLHQATRSTLGPSTLWTCERRAQWEWQGQPTTQGLCSASRRGRYVSLLFPMSYPALLRVALTLAASKRPEGEPMACSSTSRRGFPRARQGQLAEPRLPSACLCVRPGLCPTLCVSDPVTCAVVTGDW